MNTIIQEIYGVWRFNRPAGHVGKARSTPGHLIHFVASGGYHLTTDNREYDLRRGDLIYYFESEDVVWRGGDAPVIFYSIGLHAPDLSPPNFSSRVLTDRLDLEGRFIQSLELFDGASGVGDRLKLFGLVSEILSEFFDRSESVSVESDSLWWQLEYEIKRKRLFRADLTTLCDLAGYSRATVIRACKESTKMTPIARLRSLRMEEAKGLLLYSMSSISDVSNVLGYGRIHEFSRDFSTCVGVPPTVFRSLNAR